MDNPVRNGAEPVSDRIDWKAEAQFWQRKYFEQLTHSTQVITALSRPMMAQQTVTNLQAIFKAATQSKNMTPKAEG